MKHTKEPWSFNTFKKLPDNSAGYQIFGNREMIAELELTKDLPARGNALRIVLCVNALEGLNPEALKELIEAAEQVIFETDNKLLPPSNGSINCLQSALAKVKQ